MNTVIRTQQVYHTDDNRRIEAYTKTTLEIEGERSDYSDKEIIFVGVITVNIGFGPEEIRFVLDANTIPEAFAKFNAEAETVGKEFVRSRVEAVKQLKQEKQGKIVTAPAEALKVLNG